MTNQLWRGIIAALVFGSGVAGHLTAQAGRTSSATAAAQKSSRAAAKGPLPDPALLDGSKQPPEKKPEQGMLGEFELPGDENAREEKVGGSQGQPGGGQPTNEQTAQSGGGGPQSDQEAQSGGGPAGQQQQQAKAGGQSGGKNDPNAKAEGMQVAGLQGEGSGEAGEASAQKPPQVAIGDTAMQIKNSPVGPNVVGVQTSGPTQQMEKAIGTGGKQATGSNSNRGAEKGRTMPAGL